MDSTYSRGSERGISRGLFLFQHRIAESLLGDVPLYPSGVLTTSIFKHFD